MEAPITGLSLRALFPHAAVTLGIAVLGSIVVLRFRDHLVGALQTRRARAMWELLPVVVINGAIALVMAAVEWRTVFAGTISASDDRKIWTLAVLTGCSATLQVFTAAHADLAEEIRRRLGQEHQHALAALRALYERQLVAVRTELEEVRTQRNLFTRITESFLKVVSRKRERLVKESDESRIGVLAPHYQSQRLVIACWEILEWMVNRDEDVGRAKYRVRVAYFRAIQGRLECAYCWDGISGDCVTGLIRNDAAVRSRFDLEAEDSCLAVAASRTGTPYWVKNADRADSDPKHPFVHFDPSERALLKSIVALPIKIGGDSPPYDVITVDTNRENHFDKQHEKELNIVLNNLAHRLQLEKALEASLPEVEKCH